MTRSAEEDQEIDLIARARRALSPSAGDQQRVREAVRRAVAGAPAPVAGNGTTAATATRASRLFALGAVAAVAGGIGYWGGHRAGVRDGQARAAAQVIAVRPLPELPAPAAAIVAAPAAPGTPPPQSPPPDPARHRHAAPPAKPVELSPADSLAEEVRALRSVERALRDEQPGLALALLRELDRAVPQGKLIEERQATLAIARCLGGEVPFGVDLGDDFAGRYPDSVYLARVAQACAAGKRIPASAETHAR
jgi:hypothetical protein